jgi:Type IV secretion-system coupling protein DNA-binding domain
MDENAPQSDPFRLQPQSFSLTLEERLRHVYVGGKTGVGKSTLLYNLAATDIEAGHGVCFIDPHGDEVERLLDAIPKSRINDVIYFNVADRDFPVSFNPIAGLPERQRPRRVSDLVSSFAHVWHDAWGHSSEQIMRNAIGTLIATPGMSLVALPRLLTDPQFRSVLVSRVTDPVVRAYWRDQFDTYKDDQRNQKIAPVLNKAEELIAEPHLRNILATGSNTIEPRTIIDGKKILLVNLAKGLIGESACNILGCILLSLLGSSALARRDQSEDEREPFFSFVDEAHNFATTSLVSQLGELRKYRYALLLASQFLDQLGESVRDAILGVAGSLIVFEVSPADAELLSPHFGHLDPSELAVQSIGHAWVKRKDSFDALFGHDARSTEVARAAITKHCEPRRSNLAQQTSLCPTEVKDRRTHVSIFFFDSSRWQYQTFSEAACRVAIAASRRDASDRPRSQNNSNRNDALTLKQQEASKALTLMRYLGALTPINDTAASSSVSR